MSNVPPAEARDSDYEWHQFNEWSWALRRRDDTGVLVSVAVGVCVKDSEGLWHGQILEEEDRGDNLGPAFPTLEAARNYVEVTARLCGS